MPYGSDSDKTARQGSENIDEFFLGFYGPRMKSTRSLLIEHYQRGDSPVTAAQSFIADRECRKDLRDYVSNQVWSSMSDCREQFPGLVYDSDWEPVVYKNRLTTEGILLRSDTIVRRNQWPDLKDQEYYSQLIALSWATAEYCKDVELSQQLESSVKEVQVAEHVAQGYLHCDLPPGYLETINRDELWMQEKQEVLKCDLPPSYQLWLELRANHLLQDTER